MVFSSSLFLFVFFPIICVIYFLIPRKKVYYRNIWLLFVSLAFYSYGEPVYIFVMLSSIVINFYLGIIIENTKGRHNKKAILIIACIYNVGVLFVFKYLGWLWEVFSLSRIRPIIALTLPVGISFYTFQVLSYIVDVYRGKINAQRNIINLGLYISFFPQLIAGPIVQYTNIEMQLTHRKETFENVSIGIKRFIIGLSKKVLIADMISVLANSAFDCNASERTVLFGWIGCIAYTMQIYYDFSGYSDMAIGLSRIFGFEILNNFNFPYISSSISEFWDRWHISLGAWFREYIYIPLGGNRKGLLRKNINIMIVFFISGLWHGASWNFVLWGILHGLFQVIENVINSKFYRNTTSKIKKNINILMTFLMVSLLWVLFRAPDLNAAMDYYLSMFHMNSNLIWDIYSGYWFKQYVIIFAVAIICQIPIVDRIKIILTRKYGIFSNKVFDFVSNIVLIPLFCIDICYIVGSRYNPFLYFNF